MTPRQLLAHRHPTSEIIGSTWTRKIDGHQWLLAASAATAVACRYDGPEKDGPPDTDDALEVYSMLSTYGRGPGRKCDVDALRGWLLQYATTTTVGEWREWMATNARAALATVGVYGLPMCAERLAYALRSASGTARAYVVGKPAAEALLLAGDGWRVLQMRLVIAKPGCPSWPEADRG